MGPLKSATGQALQTALKACPAGSAGASKDPHARRSQGYKVRRWRIGLDVAVAWLLAVQQAVFGLAS